ncbi:O-antigen ligase family protein [Verrucomicrobiales bacterium]|nr:O-antigen ligase family protein [Verrucomicrobiales bacterium]
MIDRDGNDLMAKATNVSLLYLIVVTWLFGGGFSWGPYLVGGGGILCLVFALRAARLEGQQRWWSWRLLPWVLWLALVGISVWNPSHAPKDAEIGREFVVPHGKEARDTLGLVNPAVPVEHVVWLPTTTDAPRSGLYLFAFAGVFSFAVALAILPMSRGDVRRWLTVIFANSIIMTLIGLWWFFDDRDLVLGMYPTEGAQPFASFHYKNNWTAYAVLSAAIGIGMGSYWWKAGRSLFKAKSPTAFFVFATPLLVLTLPLIQSRAGVFIGTLLVMWLGVVVWNGYRVSERKSPWPMVVLAVAVGLLGWFSWSTTAPEIQRMLKKSERQLEQVTADEPTGRMVLFRDTVAMAKEKPWFGWGLASFSQVYPAFQGPELYHKVNFRDGDFAWVPSYYEFAHCDWAQYWAETGVVGLLLLLGTPLLWFVYHLRKGRGNSITHWLGVGCVLVMILAWFEFPFGAEAVSLLFAACFTFAGKYADMSEQSRKRRKRRRRREDERLPMKETALITERS